jgi:hypothetical protein
LSSCATKTARKSRTDPRKEKVNRWSPTTPPATRSTPATDVYLKLRRTRWEPAVSFARNAIPIHRATS